jgi:hypothetical protein
MECKNYIHKYKCEHYNENPENCKTCELRTENKFEEYYPYLGGIETSEEDLMKHFKCFLEFPEHCGIFIVRWKENDKFECRYTLNEYIEMINKKVEGD